MRIESLPNNMVYTDGSDFWIVSEKKYSSWALKIDWYVNFLMARAERKDLPQLSDNIKTILKEEEIELPAIKPLKNPPLYISTEQFLPNKALIVVPYEKQEQDQWLNAIKETWQKLKQPKLRVFLPKNFDEKKFQDFSEKNFDNDITYVREETYPT